MSRIDGVLKGWSLGNVAGGAVGLLIGLFLHMPMYWTVFCCIAIVTGAYIYNDVRKWKTQ